MSGGPPPGRPDWRGVLALGSLHRSGHLREEAVRALAAVPDDAAVGYLVLRANDWVLPVREVALSALRSRLVPAAARAFARNAPTILVRSELGRGRDSGLGVDVGRFLALDQCRDAAAEALRSETASVRRAVQRLLRRASTADVWTATVALDSTDAGVRLFALLHVVPGLQEEPRRSLYRRALEDPVSGARSVGLEGWLAVETDPDERARVLRRFLLDRSASLRNRARWHLGWREGETAAAWYRAALDRAAPPSLSAAVAGLGETGGPSDAPRVVPLLSHPHGSVRRAALRAWARLDPAGASERLVSFLAAPDLGLQRVACDLLRTARPTPDIDAIERLAREASSPRVRRYALEILERQPAWSALALFLDATGDPDEGLAAWAATRLDLIERRINLHPTQPTTADLDRARRALDSARTRLSPSALLGLDFALKTTLPR